MKGFESYFGRAELDEWKSQYVDYGRIKELLHSCGTKRQAIRKDPSLLAQELAQGTEGSTLEEYQLQDADEHDEHTVSEDALHQLSLKERAQFRSHLQQELQKSTEFYQTCLTKLRQRVMKPLEPTVTATSETPDEQQDIEVGSNMEELGKELLNLYSFCVVNIICIRQALLRYNAYARMYDGCVGLSEWDLLQGTGDSSMLQSQESLFEFEPLSILLTNLVLQLNADKRSQAADELQAQVKDMDELLSKTLTGVEKAAGGHWTKRDRFLLTTRQYFLIGSKHVGMSLEPKFLMAKGRHLKREMKAMAKWREANASTKDDGEDESDHLLEQMDPANIWPLFLNLASCFLFMMNNYIIEPSSAYYANALGTSDALSGLMLGMAPWFALCSSIGFSIWTNTSYKTPIVFATVLMVIGNTLYGSAYSYMSMEMCLVGRAIAGLGAPRIINRRYVADATPFALRTMSSAAFALTSALGAALGPGVAIVLDAVPDFEFYLPILGMQNFNGMTGPGFLMALLWFIYLIAVLLTFSEPNRSGLEELKRREQDGALEPLQNAEEQAPVDGKSREVFDDDDSLGPSERLEEESRASSEVSKNSPMYCIKHMTRATALCMGLIFMKRIALECIVGSTSVITKNRYQWSIKNVGTLHLVNGLIVIPSSIFSGWLSQFYEDRYLSMWFMSMTAFGMLFLVDPTDLLDPNSSDSYNSDSFWSVGPVKYILGSLVAFSGIECCESFLASLMSKCVPSALAVGTFNSGLLATLVGTSGRAVGDLFITAMGLISIRHLLNLLIIPGLGLVLFSMFLMHRNYKIVAV